MCQHPKSEQCKTATGAIICAACGKVVKERDIIEYCRDCKYLSVKEHEQKPKEDHICHKYNKQVRHLGHHPELPRLPECDEPKYDYRSIYRKVIVDRHLPR